jgi:hypothetical protein
MSPRASGTVVFLLHQLQEFEHHARAALRVGGGPAGLRGLGIRDRLLDLGALGERDAGLHLARIGIKHVALAAGSVLDGLAADEMPDLTHGRFAPFQTVTRRLLPVFPVVLAHFAARSRRKPKRRAGVFPSPTVSLYPPLTAPV